MGTSCAAIFLYADDVILLAPSVHALQLLVNIYDCKLKFSDMAINARKSSCTRFGPRHKSVCAEVSLSRFVIGRCYSYGSVRRQIMAIRTALRMPYEYQRCNSYAAMHPNANPNHNPNPVAIARETGVRHAKDDLISLEPVHRSGSLRWHFSYTANNQYLAVTKHSP